MDMGPSAIRYAGLEAGLEQLGHTVKDQGNRRFITGPSVRLVEAVANASLTWPRICGSPTTSESSDAHTRITTFEGLLRLQIGQDGRVTTAEIVRPSHPAYDVAVLQAAKKWLYKPATRGGQPVPSQKEIRVRLVPR